MVIYMKHLRYETKKKWVGMAFSLPWLLGFIFFFLKPMINSILFSISKIGLNETGPVYTFIGFGHYHYLFISDPTFLVETIKSALGVFGDLFLTIAFSIFIALILVQRFKGRLVARAMFFLPVIVASGVVIGIINGDLYSQQLMQGDTAQMQLTVLTNVLQSTGLSIDLISAIVGTMNSIFSVVWKSGIQILIFMTGLQAIPPSVKEAASVEGATSWEFFWKITFPMIMPVLQLNVIYTVINSFTDASNPIISRMFMLNRTLDYSYSSAIAWTYFSIVFILVIILYTIINRISARYER